MIYDGVVYKKKELTHFAGIFMALSYWTYIIINSALFAHFNYLYRTVIPVLPSWADPLEKDIINATEAFYLDK